MYLNILTILLIIGSMITPIYLTVGSVEVSQIFLFVIIPIILLLLIELYKECSLQLQE